VRLVTTVLLSAVYWLVAVPVVFFFTVMIDCNADGCGMTYGVVPLLLSAAAIGGFISLLILRRETGY
jgi:hypothetical protein